MLLSAEHLSINFGSRQLLEDVNFYLNEGDKVGVIGINGTGKSTLGCAITGSPAYTVTAGRILFDGEDITHMSITERARRGISFAFQQPVRFKGITVFDLISIASCLLYTSDAADD